MVQAIMYDPERQDNFYYIIAQAKEMQADLTQVRRDMETATFAFYILAFTDEVTGVTTIESWCVDGIRQTWKFKTQEDHLCFKEIEWI
jgi:hypothetical protein